MQCEYRHNACGRTTAAESVADAWSRDGRDVDYREMDPDWRPLTPWQPYRPGTAARYAPPAPPDAQTDPYVPPDPVLEIDRDTMRRLGELADLSGGDECRAVATAVAAHHTAVFGPVPSPNAGNPSDPPPTKETTMRIAVKSAGGITECFLHAENAKEGAKDAARQIAEDYGLPVDVELWSDPPDGAPRRLGELRFVALAGDGTVLQLD
ncbi:MAG: hypothetical protein OXH15_17375 [Gammaproteobacteria bacterium]|nr:hypothetical protein [Gammaproteobacteria bacterium]